MIIHLGMTGQLIPGLDLSDPHLRAWWKLDNDVILGYRDVRRFGRIRIYSSGEYEGTLKNLALNHFRMISLLISFTIH